MAAAPRIVIGGGSITDRLDCDLRLDRLAAAAADGGGSGTVTRGRLHFVLALNRSGRKDQNIRCKMAADPVANYARFK